tara:strand:- start:3559 stop:4020 length:462 start_codon:yes stop_codon:yes gene_type:complete
MPHQCTKCGKVYPDASEEVLTGCSCGARFFYYIREMPRPETKDVLVELEKSDKQQIEKDIREISGLEKEPDKPVILDLESVKVIKPGKFEIDIINLFNKKRPLIYKLEEGKYIIDLAATLKATEEQIHQKIRDPEEVGYKKESEDSKEESTAS